MKSKLLLILILSGLLLAGQGIVFGQTTDKLKITVDVIGTGPKSVEIDFVVGPVACPDEINNWPVVGGTACKAWDWLGLSIETDVSTFKLKIKNPVQEEIKLTDLPKEYTYQKLTLDVAKIKIELLSVSGGFTLKNPLQAESFQELVENMINFVWVISLVVTPLMILIAGFLFLTAGGQPNQITSAKKMIFWTILGFVIITLAEGIIAMLKGILGG